MVQKFTLAAATASLASFAQAWLPEGKIRGVNVGTMFVFEPWMDDEEWQKIGCNNNDQKSEFDCVLHLGQEEANTAFQEHYNTWITETDLDEMKSYGLNTIRIPLGYWLNDDLVDSSEHFPRGALDRLTDFVGQAKERNFYIIIDLHGGPGAQEAEQPFTGQYASEPGFYNDYNYGRAVEWLTWMTDIIHTTPEFSQAGLIQLINEPLHGDTAIDSLRSQFYVDALEAIRKVESDLNVSDGDRLHVQMMSSLWGSGDPTEFLPSTDFTAYDDHRYLKWDTSVPVEKDAFVQESCGDDRNAEEPLIVGEWSLSVPDDVEWTDAWNPFDNTDFYKRWFSAQVQAYERSTTGWVFWSWKTNLGDPRWSYKDAVSAGLIPENVQEALDADVC